MDGKPDEQTGRDGQTNKRTKRQTEGDKYLQTEKSKEVNKQTNNAAIYKCSQHLERLPVEGLSILV